MLSTANVAKLARHFRVSPAAFIAKPTTQPPVSGEDPHGWQSQSTDEDW
ncbi:MAG: hypothetical protein NTY19_19835 [Planctomycetota bacterium]|nr:hypothetical protein [Planctomycetota bacterium]